MRKFMLMGALVAIVIAALSIPAMAQDGIDDERQAFQNAFQAAFADNWEDVYEDRAEERDYTEKEASKFYFDRLAHFYGFDGFGNDDRWNDDDNDDRDHWWNDDRNDDDDNDRDWWNDDRRDDDRNNNDRNNDDAAPVITQESDQSAESGDVSQSFNVSNTGDNSNQCAGLQGVANTGNAQNQISVVQNGSEAGDFSFEDSGSSIEVSPSNYTSCDQEVNQAASAYYGGW